MGWLADAAMKGREHTDVPAIIELGEHAGQDVVGTGGFQGLMRVLRGRADADGRVELYVYRYPAHHDWYQQWRRYRDANAGNGGFQGRLGRLVQEPRR